MSIKLADVKSIGVDGKTGGGRKTGWIAGCARARNCPTSFMENWNYSLLVIPHRRRRRRNVTEISSPSPSPHCRHLEITRVFAHTYTRTCTHTRNIPMVRQSPWGDSALRLFSFSRIVQVLNHGGISTAETIDDPVKSPGSRERVQQNKHRKRAKPSLLSLPCGVIIGFS